MMTDTERRYLQAKITTIQGRPRPPRRDLAALDTRLAALERDAPLARRDVRRTLRRRLDLLAGDRAQAWTSQWATEYEHLALAIKREEASDAH
jgi:hypothetical protein